MGIVNVTPDSFSDGGKFYAQDAAVDHALKLVAEGADILDFGGESTRPYSAAVDIAEERNRVLPVIERVAAQTTTPLSIDTTKSAVARAAIDAGAEIINDISGLEADPAMLPLAVESGAAICAMHMQGTPQTMQDNPHYGDVVADILEYLQNRLEVFIQAGVEREKICLDPGIGFGKTHQHNLTLAANCEPFLATGRPILVGLSRKGFIGKVLQDKETERTFGTIGAALAVARQKVQILRVHDVLAIRQALLLYAACGGITGAAWNLESALRPHADKTS